MDGNGRWAERRDLPRSAGHREGIEAVRRVVEAAPELGIGALTLFAFSSDNWRRPPLEVEVLMLLLRQYLRRDVRRLAENGVRLRVIGRRDRLPDGLPRRSRPPKHATARTARARSHRSDRLLGARRDRECRDRLARRSLARAPGVHAAARAARATARPRRRSADPYRRREAPLRLPAVGMRLRGAAVHRTMWPDFGAEHLPPRSTIPRARAPLRRPRSSRRNDSPERKPHD